MSQTLGPLRCRSFGLAPALAVLLAAVPGWVNSFVAHYRPNGRARTLTGVQCQAALAAARRMPNSPIEYDPSYFRIPYPGGDVPATKGVCADVIVRSFRAASLDLQEAVHVDMQRSLASYPSLWPRRAPDANIDHRRVPNLMTWFVRNGAVLPLDTDFRPCDVVAWDLGSGVTHIGLVSSPRAVVHHIGGHPAEEDVLHAWRIIGHFAF